MTGTLVRLAVRNTQRHKARIRLTAGMVVAAVALLMVGLSWVGGVFGRVLTSASDQGGHVRVVVPEYAAREELMPLWANLPDTAALEALLARQPGVMAVEPRLSTGVTVTVGEEIGEVFALAVGASERYFRERLGAREHLVQGAWFTGAAGELVLGARVAEDLKARVGEEVVLLGLTQDGSISPLKGRIVGIVKTGSLVDRQVLVPLAALRYLADIPTGATELLVYGARYEQAAELERRLRALPELRTYLVQSWNEREPMASFTRIVTVVELIIGFVVVLLAALGIWNTMTTSVLERTHEIGVLRAMGLSRLGAVGLFVVEAVVIAVGGGVVGVLVGLGPCLLLEKYGIHLGEATTARLTVPITETVHGELSWAIVAGAFALGLLTAILGSAPAALRAASVAPVTAMKSGR
jgi:ABC-type lipoprotein release transport system permease subunit